MRTGLAALAMLCLIAVTAPAQVLFENGPINGTVDAWTINFGFAISDTFTLTDPSTVKGFDLGVWEFPGDKVLSVDWMISSGEFGGKLYGEGTAQLTDTFISINQYGYAIDTLHASGLNVAMPFGTYWFTLQNAVSQQGNPIYWDENDGIGCHSEGCPSQASDDALGTLPSESFDVTGVSGSSSSGQTPEPGEFVLFASGLLTTAGVIRRKLW